MSGGEQPGAITLTWHGGQHTFRLAAYGELFALETACNAGTMEVLERLTLRRWRVKEICEVLRLGLIGGGMDSAKAAAIIEASVEKSGRWVENAITARAVLYSGIMGPPEELPVKKKRVRKATKASASSAAPSTAAAPS